MGSKMILDATRRPKAAVPRKVITNRAFRIDPKAKDSRIIGWRLLDEALLVVQVRQDGRKILETLVRDNDFEGVKLVAVVSPDVDLDDSVSTIWGIFTRFDCARDVVFTETHLVGSVARYSGRLGLDATFKPGYPDPLEMTEEIRDKVTARWADYGL